MSKLIIEEPPLQVLPSLAIAIGLNNAIVLQQLHYLLRNPKFGRRIAEEQWIFNTYEEWRCQYFPFWSHRTIERAFTELSKFGLIKSCQPEGRGSRRKYYAIDDEKLSLLSERAKLAASNPPKSEDRTTQNGGFLGTKTTRTETTGTKKSKESKETFSGENAGGLSEFEAEWKPISGTKQEQLRRIEPPIDYPSEAEFNDFIEDEDLEHIAIGKRADLYRDLCRDKWHQWKARRWVPIRDWEKYVRALNDKMETATTNGGRF